MIEFTYARFWKIFLNVFVPIALIAIGIFIWYIDFNKGNNSFVMLAFSLVAMIVLILALFDVQQAKFVITDDKVFTIGIFNKRELFLEEISGFKQEDKYIYIETDNPNKKRLKISTYFAKTDDILFWLSVHYTDLNLEREFQEKESILNNPLYGWTEEERENKLKVANRWSNVLNVSALIVSIWTLFYPKPYTILVCMNIAFPMICIGFIKYYKGLIRINDHEKSAYPNLTLALLLPSLVICVRGISDYNLMDSDSLILPGVLLSLGLLIILLLNHDEFRLEKISDLVIILLIALIFYAYCYGTILCLNAMLDHTPAQLHTAKVLEKRKTSGKYTSYYVEISQWGPLKSTDELSVKREKYDEIEVGQQVQIEWRPGFFKFPWYQIR